MIDRQTFCYAMLRLRCIFGADDTSVAHRDRLTSLPGVTIGAHLICITEVLTRFALSSLDVSAQMA